MKNIQKTLRKIAIPNTTLCCIDCLNYKLSIRALEYCLRLCHFERVIFFTDRAFNLNDINVVTISAINTKEQYSRFVIKELNKYINTDFVLMIQYDGFIINPHAWTDEFLKYDYIGAKWQWYNDGFRVGNGGFSFRSRRLLKALSDEAVKIDSVEYGEDTLICRTYRGFLENKYGIKFAPEFLADKFSYERAEPQGLPFGFHGLYNMGRYITIGTLKDFVNNLSPQTLKSIEALELGISYHKSGQLKEAEIVYRKILEVKPDHKDALTLLKAIQTSRMKGGRNKD